MHIDPVILREYDIRGIIGDNLDADVARALGSAFGDRVRAAGGSSVAVGRDGRLSSPDIAAGMIAGLSEAGMTVFDVGMGPTPMLYFSTYELGADAGVMVTGSHNPPNYNGLKMMLKGGPFFAGDIQTLGASARDYVARPATGPVEERPVFDRYVETLVGAYRDGRPLKVVWDAGNGVAGPATEALVARIPGTHTCLFTDVDGTFPNHHPDPTVEKNLVDLKQAVKQQGADVGIGFDGDGDRIGVVDSEGRVLWGDQLMCVLATEVLETIPGATVIADVKTSQVFFDEVARLGGKPLMGRTGHSLIKKMMKETGAPLAGEMSGHIFFADEYHGFDDALYAAVRLLRILAASDRSLADMRDDLPALINTPEMRFPCNESRKFAVVDEVRNRVAARGEGELNDIDGVRLKTADGWWLLRASNTQDVLVARCESETEAGLEKLRAALTAELQESGITLPEA
ncbi:phosphomannomutase [Alphaproteobacteria bacterium HT1-32]|nr:phosphomannomutase [Alphaproteobacteria bacterium HT1-32]